MKKNLSRTKNILKKINITNCSHVFVTVQNMQFDSNYVCMLINYKNMHQLTMLN